MGPICLAEPLMRAWDALWAWHLSHAPDMLSMAVSTRGMPRTRRASPKPASPARGRFLLPGPGCGCPRPGFSARDAPRCLSPARRAGSPPFVLDPAQHCQAPPCSARCRLRLPQSSPIKRLASFQGRGSGLARTLPRNRCSCGTRTSKDTPTGSRRFHAEEQRQAGGKHAARSAPLAVCCGFSPRCVPVTIICPEKDGTSAKPGRILRCNHIDCADNEKVPRTTVEWL